MGATVKEVMSSPAITISEEKTVKEAGQLMKKTRRGALIVVREDRPVGIITDSDLVKRIVAAGLSSDKLKVRDIMSKPLVTIKADEVVLNAVRKMKKINVRRLPVTDEKGSLVGILSLTDVARTSPEMLDVLEYRIKMKEEEPTIKTETTAGICDSCDNYSDRLRHVEDQWICDECAGDLEEE